MKKSQFAILLFVMVLGFAAIAIAQSYGSVAFGPIAPAVSNCPAGFVGTAALCAVGTSAGSYTMWISYNGAAYQLLVPTPAPAGVVSLNGRTGVVQLTKADVLATGISVSTTVTSTATSTVQ